nr:putative reverse transcriptase domain, aspartic peptidase domain protein [Tanacetum cinerariifolium]
DIHAPEFIYHGSLPGKSMQIISALQARTLLSHGREGFLATIHDMTSDVPSIHDQPVVSEFPDVFPDKLPAIPLVREVEFRIELISGAEPISKAPYHIALIELKEVDQHSFNTESDLIGSMPNHDSSIIISLKIGSLFNEFVGELTLLKSFPPGINEIDCHLEKEIRFAKRLLYDNSSPCPPEEIVYDNSNADIKSFSPSPIPNEDSDSHMEEIDLYFNLDDPMPPGIEEDDDDSEKDILLLEELLDNYSLSLPTNESYHFDIPSLYRPPAKPPDGNTGTLNIKMMGDVSDQKVPIPNLTITRILNQEKSLDLLSHQGLEAFQPSAECPMIINGKNSIPPGIAEANCDPVEDIHLVERLLYDNSSPRPLKEFVSANSNAKIKSFSPSPIPVEDSDSHMEEIDLYFNPDDPMPRSIEEDDDESERGILIHEELLDNYSLSLLVNESFHFDIPSFSRPPAKPPDGNT